MLKVMLYIIIVFIQTSLGIWIFAQAFPKRTRMERRHQVSEWILITTLVITTYSFTVYYCPFIDKEKFLWFLVVLYIFLLIGYLFYKKMQSDAAEKQGIVMCFFLISCILLVCQYWLAYESTNEIVTANIYPVLFLFSFYGCSFKQAYLWEIFYLTNIGLTKSVYIIYMGIFGKRDFEDFFFYPRSHTYGEIVYWCVILFVVFLLVKYLPIKDLIRYILEKYKTVLFLITLAELIIVYFFVNKGSGEADSKNLAGILIVFTAFVFALIVLLIRFLKKTEDTEKQLFAVHNEAMKHQYQELSDAYERYRHLVHDEKHILSYLKECLEDGEYTEALSFIESSQNRMIDKSKSFWTGITTLDFMLNIKKRKMDHLGIQFELSAGVSVIPMEDADFVVFLGNLLDNAIEAVEQCTPENRRIWMSIQNANEMFLLRMKNSYTVVPQRKKGRFLTQKGDEKNHGIGIESVKQIVEKYEGEIQFEYNHSYFDVNFFMTEKRKD